MRLSFKSIIFGIVLSFIGGTGLAQGAVSPSADSTSLLMDAWSDYLKKYDTNDLQAQCRPQMRQASPDVPRRGAVFLLHGFTACPQQYFDWSRELSSQGFDVFLLLLPGEGKKQVHKHDVIDALPLRDQWERYISYAEEVNALAALSPGEKIIGGLSLGAAIATQASLLQPDLYDQQILISPFLRVSGSIQNAIVENFSNLKSPVQRELEQDFGDHSFLNASGLKIGWGPGCYKERQGGRAGMCTFRFGSLEALNLYGDFILSHVRKVRAKVQIVAVENDSAAATFEMKTLLQKYQSAGTQADICFLPKGIPHSVISKFDAPQITKWWLAELDEDLTQLSVSGEALAHGTESIHEPGYSLCKLASKKPQKTPSEFAQLYKSIMGIK